MRTLLGMASLVMLGTTACGAARTTFVHSETTTLGRVVVYRNGVAYFERYAKLDGDTLELKVPADKVDDFLKSLTVVDAQTGQPAPVSYPSDVQRQGSSLIDMKITLPGPRPHSLKLSYVTEAPAWKPSYRVVVGKDGHIDVQGWAVVDNTSGEDWKDVKLGVGSSSALSFRYDLRSIRLVERETLHSNDLFALAPPTGGSTYGGPAEQKLVVSELSDDAIAANEPSYRAPTTVTHAGTGSASGGAGAPPAARAAPAVAVEEVMKEQRAHAQLAATANSIRAGNQTVVIEGYASGGDKDQYGASLDRANRVREQLVRNGVDPNKVVAVGRGAVAGRDAGVAVVQAPPPPREKDRNAKAPADAPPPQPADPIGTSHFESQAAMNVPRGSSAMVSILRATTEGEVVYLYDPESARGNTTFPFRAVRLRNPTDSTLESGPMTVFGEGRFIGEGLSEPIPAKSIAFIPFALDRQVVIESKGAEQDQIEKILTVQRGVFSAQVRHTRKTHLHVVNRLAEPATVYVRHTVPDGYELAKSLRGAERLGPAQVFKVSLLGHAETDLDIEESTPLFRTMDLRSPGGMELVRVFISGGAVDPALRARVLDLSHLQEDMANYEQRIATTREQMGEYRQRVDELHNQIFTLKAVRTAGPLMASLEKKMQEMGDKVSQGTIDVVALEEKLMISRIKFQDAVAELTTEKTNEARAAR